MPAPLSAYSTGPIVEVGHQTASADGVAQTAKLVPVKQEGHTGRGSYGEQHDQQETTNATREKSSTRTATLDLSG